MSTQIVVYQNLADKQRKGYAAISLDSLVSTTAITIKAGSECEVAGALYEFQADEVESGGTWAGIGASNTVYVYIVPNGSTATFIYSTTAPTWDTAKQGWYNGTSRAVASLYKDAGGLYQLKTILPSWSQASFMGGVARKVIVTSGTLGALSVSGDTDYILTAASTATLPLVAPLGCRLTFKAKTNATSTFSGPIGTTSSTSFSIYAQEDYVTFEWDGSIWYVVATNGPLLTSLQTASAIFSVGGSWTALGNGFSLGSLAPGVYDLELECTVQNASSTIVSIAIGNGTTPISEIGYFQPPSSSMGPMKISLKGYVLTASAVIQGLYNSSSASGSAYYSGGASVGRITARRVA